MSTNDTFFPINTFQKKLHEWYAANHRSLPWRETKDPYLIWLSEIILQQTRVAQGTEYYLRFASRWPTLQSLAMAKEQDVLKEWQGLGYYSRARNLLTAARNMFATFGKFPDSYEEILHQKGIGPYTAAAVSSIAYDLPYAVLDGNVFRFVSRLFGIATPIDSVAGKKEFYKMTESLLDRTNAGLHNQAMMEFGAVQCIPTRPECSVCPFQSYCVALSNHSVNSLPVKTKRNKSKDRFFNYLFLSEKSENNVFTLLQKRTGRDIWKNLYEFPLIESDHCFTDFELLHQGNLLSLFPEADNPTILSPSFSIRHVLSHQNIYARFFSISLTNLQAPHGYLKIPISAIDTYPISRLTEIFLDSFLSQIQNSQ